MIFITFMFIATAWMITDNYEQAQANHDVTIHKLDSLQMQIDSIKLKPKWKKQSKP